MTVKYAEDNFHTIESKQDNCPPHGQQPDGSGRKSSMPYLVRLNETGPWRRVYCCCFSNSGTVYELANRYRNTPVGRVDSKALRQSIVDSLGLHPYNHVQFFEEIRDDNFQCALYLATIHEMRIREVS